MKFCNKNLLIITILLFGDLNVYTMNPEPITAALERAITSISTSTSSSSSIGTFDVTPYNFSAETAVEKLTFQTITYEDKITLEVDYHNKETGEFAHAEKQLCPDNSLETQSSMQCDQTLSSSNSDTSYTSNNTSEKPDILNDLLSDSACDTRRQGIDENHATQTHNTTKEHLKVIREQSLQKNRVYFHKDFGGIPLDSDLILQKPNVFHDPRSTLSSPVIAARFDRLVTFYTYKANLNSKFQSELTFCEALRSGKVLDLFNQIYDGDLPTAQAAFNELKKLWIRGRKHMFLVNNSYNNRELDFITKLGIDIMIKAERALVTRVDYIAEYADPQSLKIIQEYKEFCTQLQRKGDRSALLNEIERLRPTVKKRSDFATKISFAIAQKTTFDPMTTVLHEIAHASSFEKACDQLKNLEKKIITQAEQRGLISMNEVRSWVTNQYGYDVLDAAHNCYKSRPDYVYTSNNQSYLSDTMKPILSNIESKDLPRAHAELVNLEKQLAKGFTDKNITSTAAQKEHMRKYFGKDVLEVAHKKYEARLDHKKLVESFMDIDVNQSMATILENNNSYESVANEMSDLAKRIFVNGHLCNLSNLPKIESHVYDSIDAIRTAQDQPTFIFNLSMVNRTLGDIQQIAHAILNGTHPVMQRSSELLIRGFSTFFKNLNPLTQASNMGHLASDLGSLLKKGVTALWNDPIHVIHNGMNSTCTLIDLIRSTADFTSDLTVGRLYLPAEGYKQRIDTFCAMMELLQGVTAEHCVDFAAQLAADTVTLKGIGSTYRFLKEIDALEKLGESAAAVARVLKKGFDTHLANNPIMVTAEGIAFRMSNDLKNVGGAAKEVINTTRGLIDSMTNGILSQVRKDIEAFIKNFACEKCLPECAKRGFAEFKNGHIKIAHEHILGIELIWNDAKNTLSGISGFHHDFMGTLESSGLVKFVRTAEKNGCYMTDIFVGENRVPGKTFFPQHWSREEVIGKIYEAYENFIKSGATPELGKGGKYIINSVTNEGIEIRMYITKKGQMTTAYPIIKPGV